MRFAALLFGQAIGFVDHEYEIGDFLGDFFYERDLVSGNRRVRTHDDESGIDVWHEGPSNGGVGGEDRADARRVDEAHSRRQEVARHEDFDCGNALLVPGVSLFRDVFGEGFDIDRLPPAFGEADRALRRRP